MSIRQQVITYVTAGSLALGGAGYGLITHFEGKENTAYRDVVGVPTICYGHTKGVKMGTRASDAECTQMLTEDVTDFGRGLSKSVKVPVSQQQYDALLSFSYNVGLGNLNKSTLLRKLNAKDYCGAAKEFPKWKYAGGKPLRGLERRRLAEQELFISGTKEKC